MVSETFSSEDALHIIAEVYFKCPMITYTSHPGD